MQYEGDVYRPPSEAGSLLVQVTIGCAWNKCTFCTMYKNKQFRVRPFVEIEQDLNECVPYAPSIRRIFLCDGNALVLAQDKLVPILEKIQQLFPNLEAVRCYASAKDILRKTPEELCQLRELGLEMLFIGLESGSDKVLQEVEKGETKQEMIAAAQMLKKAGIKQSVSIIAGLAGEDDWQEHMKETADALNQMQPEFLGLLVLMPHGEASLYGKQGESRFKAPSELQVLKEMNLLLQNLNLNNCYFTSAHASNRYNIKGRLPIDKPHVLEQVSHLLKRIENPA